MSSAAYAPAPTDEDAAIVTAEIIAARLSTFCHLLDQQGDYDEALFEAVNTAMCRDLAELKAAHEQIRAVVFDEAR